MGKSVPLLKRILATSILLCVAAGCGSPEEAAIPTGPRPNILLVVIDTLRADHLGCYGAPQIVSPVIDRVARGGTQFSQCQSQAPWTLPAVATILSGSHPRGHGANRIAHAMGEQVSLLTERFKKSGYQTALVTSNRMLARPFGFRRGVDTFEDGPAGGPSYVSSEDVTSTAIQWISEVREPFFLFLLYFDPHNDYKYHEGITRHAPYEGSLKRALNIAALRKKRDTLSTDDLRYLTEVYDGEIRLVDRQIDHLLRSLEQQGLSENTIVVVTADHGEEFMDHGWIGHTSTLYQELLHVPLLFYAPGRRETGPAIPAQLRDDPVMLVDLYPTLLGLAGQNDVSNGPGRGRDLFSDTTDDDQVGRPMFAEVVYEPEGKYDPVIRGKGANLRSVRLGRWKAVQDLKAAEWKLFDLAADPGERVDLSKANAGQLAELQKLYKKWERETPKIKGKLTTLPSEEVEKLRALGYAQ